MHRLVPGEHTLAFIVFGILATAAQWAVLTSPTRYYEDAAINLAWTRLWQDPSLFGDPMTQLLRDTGFPLLGPRAYYILAGQFGDPIVWAEWLGVVLAAVSGLLVFVIVRRLTVWRPAAWLGALLFLFAWDIIRVRGGYSHSFAHIVLLGTVGLLLARRPVAAALVAAAGSVFYPPTAVISVVIIVATSVESLRPLRIDRLRLAAGLGFGLVAAVVLRLTTSGSTFSRAEAQSYPEFGPEGTLHFFLPSVLEMLRNNYTGFDLRASGSILLIAALVLVAVGRVRLPREVWAIPIVALAFFALAYAVLFRLYLPSRYAYPLLPFSAIAIGASLHPAATKLARGRSPLRIAVIVLLPLAVFVTAVSLFPFGVTFDAGELGRASLKTLPWVGGLVGAAAVAVLLVRRARGAVAAATLAALYVGTMLLAQMGWAGKITRQAGTVCKQTPPVAFLASLPPSTIVAGDPDELVCIPLSARRPVVISRKQYQPLLSREFFFAARERIRVELLAVFGDDLEPILELRRRYGADVLLVTPEIVQNPPEVWKTLEPWRSTIRPARAGPGRPASLRLPESCQLFRGHGRRVYDLACVEKMPNATADR